MAYRKINYTPEALERRKLYQAGYARKIRATPEGKIRAETAWQKIRDRMGLEERKQRAYRASAKVNFKKFGLAPEEYADMRLVQDCRCAICERHENEFTRSLHVDHDHKTGKVRALLCSTCNSALGGFQDNPVWMIRASRYVAA